MRVIPHVERIFREYLAEAKLKDFLHRSAACRAVPESCMCAAVESNLLHCLTFLFFKDMFFIDWIMHSLPK